VRIAFHTPLNLFSDAGISGDRRMARQLVAALESLGHTVEPVNGGRDYLGTPDIETLARRQSEAATLRDSLLARWRGGPPAPDLWFTYHNYYRAPDLLGPDIVEQLGIPYVAAEASDALRRAEGEWAAHTAIVRRGIDAADLHLYFTDRDREGLEAWLSAHAALLELPPFIAFDKAPRQRMGSTTTTPRLVTIAMMRAGTKQNSYLTLARILWHLTDRPWSLSIIGDGRQRGEIENAFAGFAPGRIDWCGALDHASAMTQLAAHDVFVWPGVREAYGLVYLEAQAIGLPVIAFDSGGVSATVKRGETALLAPEGDEAGMAAALAQLLDDPARRETMGAAARDFALGERTPERAAAILDRGIAIACRNRKARLAFGASVATP
jgi:glycosyltransferase involved in cell wall biosynthesis